MWKSRKFKEFLINNNKISKDEVRENQVLRLSVTKTQQPGADGLQSNSTRFTGVKGDDIIIFPTQT